MTKKKSRTDSYLTPGDVNTIVGGFARCTVSRSTQGKAKAAIPLRWLAVRLASLNPGKVAYSCSAAKGAHWHVGQVRDRVSQPHPAYGWGHLMRCTHQRAVAEADRQVIYGVRTPDGRWNYYARPACYRKNVALWPTRPAPYGD